MSLTIRSSAPAALLALTLVACGTGDGARSGDGDPPTAARAAGTLPVTETTGLPLDAGEAIHLTFLRGEEKLARDVYLALGARYPRTLVFSTIATRSEARHTAQVASLLARYGLPDPEPATTDLPGSIGVFTGPDFGAHFTEVFEALVARGAPSELEALRVGAFIEELDLEDLAGCPDVIVEGGFGVGPGECGLAWTDEPAIQTVYANLVDGSKSHLRAFVWNIERIVGTGGYVAQVLPQAEVDAILGR